MTDAVIFDLDGTLLDTSEDLGAALNHVLKKYGFKPISKTQYSPAISNGVMALLKVGFKENLDDFDVTTLREEVLEFYKDNIAVHTRCFDGVKQLLLSLNNRQIKVAIMTNKPTFLTLPLLQKVATLKNIKVVVCGDTLDEAKPSAKPLLFAAKQLNVEANRCMYVGDAQRDMEAAKNAKMFSICALWGYIPSIEEAKDWSADLYLTNPESIIDYI